MNKTIIKRIGAAFGHFKSLEKKGIIERIGKTGRWTHYILKR